MDLVEDARVGTQNMEMSVVVFPIPLGARKHPLAPGVCGKGSGGFRKFQWTSAGRFSALALSSSLGRLKDSS